MYYNQLEASSLSVLWRLSASQSVHYRRFDCIVIHANPRMCKTVVPYVTSCLLSALKYFLSASCLKMNFLSASCLEMNFQVT